MSHLLPGSILNEYVIDRYIANGVISAVYQGHRLASAEQVALKILHPQLAPISELVDLFTNEYYIGQRLQHAQIVRVRDMGRADILQSSLYFLARDWINGVTLRELLLNQHPRRLQPVRATMIVADIAQVIAFAHAAGVIHRDLKPENVFLDEADHIYIADFGLAYAGSLDQLTTATSASRFSATLMVGTLPYMAPEQLQHLTVDTRTDIFALGVCLFELLTGSLPYQGRSPVERLEILAHQSPPRVSDVSPVQNDALDTLVERCLAAEPERRPASMTDITLELASIAQGLLRTA